MASYTPNEFCHTPRKVLEHLLSLGYTSYSDSINPSWWDYATALRGDDFNNQTMKVLFTCIIRGRGTEDDDDFGAWDIQETIDYFNVEFPLNSPYCMDDSSFSQIRKDLQTDRYGHYISHLVGGFTALSMYYLHCAEERGETSDEFGKERVYTECSHLLARMRLSIMNLNMNDYFEDVHRFLNLVSDDR